MNADFIKLHVAYMASVGDWFRGGPTMPDFDLEAFLKDVPRADIAKRLLKSYVVIEGDAVRGHARILRDIEFFEGTDLPERAVILKTVLRLLREQTKL